MNTPTNGGPAFPRVGYYPSTVGVHPEDMHAVLATVTHPALGMSLRDYFAAQAMMGVLANSDLPDLFKKGFAPHKAAEVAYAVADAMLAERKGGAL